MSDHAERVREYYRKQGEARALAKAGHPASFNNLAFDTGVIAERQRMLKIVGNRIGHITSNIESGVFTHENWKDDLLLLNEILVEMLHVPEVEVSDV
jgi:hypothetical protein